MSEPGTGERSEPDQAPSTKHQAPSTKYQLLILLIGPKGSGKSHIGRLLEAEFGIHFFHVEPCWMAYYDTCKVADKQPSIIEGIEHVHPQIRKALAQFPRVCVETTGASSEILENLLSLTDPDQCLLVRVNAPLSVCLERIARRDPVHQISTETAEIERIYALSSKVDVSFDISLDSVRMADSEIVEAFRLWV